MNRRTFSANVAGVSILASVAGCLGSREGSSRFTVRSQRLSDGNVTEAFAEQPADLSAAQSTLVDELVSHGTAVRSGNQHSELFEDGTYTVSNNTYYLINRSTAGVETVDRDVLRAQRVDSSDLTGEAVSLDSFPDGDRRPVRRTVVFAFRGQPEGYVFYSPPEDTSKLRPDLEVEFVEYQTEYFRLSVSEEAVAADRYEYSLTEIATDEQAFATYLNSRRNITRLSSDDLTSETRTFFDELTERGEHDASSPFSEAEQNALDLLHVSQKGVGSDQRVIRYDQSYYRITVQWSHVD